jgi:hypothetical protein
VCPGSPLPFVLGAEVTKFVESTSSTTLAFDVGSSNALADGTIPAMWRIHAAWRASTECSEAMAASTRRESSWVACVFSSAA